ncbi:phage tail tube protein [Achromobacter xylosoxidans]
MTAGIVKTQGTELYFKTIGSTPTLVKMACPTGITGLGGAADQVETTCLDTQDDKEYTGGLGNPGQVSVPFNFIPTNASHQDLFDLKAGRDVLDWIILLSDGTAAPVLDSNDDIEAPAGRTSIKFQGYIADLNLDIANNEIVRGTLTIQRSGAVILTPKA